MLAPLYSVVYCAARCPRVPAAARGSTSDEPEAEAAKSPGVPILLYAIDYQYYSRYLNIYIYMVGRVVGTILVAVLYNPPRS